jgi:hypothetical protein
MTRNTEPKLTAPAEMGEPERASLALFLGVLGRHAHEASAIIGSYQSPGELIEDAQTTEADGSVNSQVLTVTGPIFEASIDLEVDVDRETAGIMRRKIEEGMRRGEDPGRRRIVRMATFAGELATWQSEQELFTNAVDAYPDSDARQHIAPAAAVVFMEPSAADPV